MLRFCCAFVLISVFQIITAQGPPPPPPNIPPHCRGPPPGIERPHECCKIPMFFTDEEFAECGFKKLEGQAERPNLPPDCSKQLCILKKHNMLKDETTIDHEALAGFLDKWAETNTAFKPAIAEAKERCVGKEIPGPPQICEANRLVACISSTLFVECPTWEESDGCKTLKAHLEECKPLFPK